MDAAALGETFVPVAAATAGWDAHLALRFERDAARTVLATRRHVGRDVRCASGEGAGGGHAPDIIKACGEPSVLPMAQRYFLF